MRKALKTLPIIIGAGILLVVAVYYSIPAKPAVQPEEIVWGVSFSTPHASSIGIDAGEAYLAVLDEMQPEVVRLSAYWNMIEPEQGQFDFSHMDWQIQEAQKRGIDVALGVGYKLPRWPECFVPEWVEEYQGTDLEERVLAMLEQSVSHFRKHDNIIIWQVENEPFFRFGECIEMRDGFYMDEVALVKSIDARPVMTTDSGEMSTWAKASVPADILGVTTYRRVWTKGLGYHDWPVSPKYYQRRAYLVRNKVDAVYSAELQAEPWAPDGIVDLGHDPEFVSEELDRIKENIEFAQEMGFPHTYFWGAEWWYWLKDQGDGRVWDHMTTFFDEQR